MKEHEERQDWKGETGGRKKNTGGETVKEASVKIQKADRFEDT